MRVAFNTFCLFVVGRQVPPQRTASLCRQDCITNGEFFIVSGSRCSPNLRYAGWLVGAVKRTRVSGRCRVSSGKSLLICESRIWTAMGLNSTSDPELRHGKNDVCKRYEKLLGLSISSCQFVGHVVCDCKDDVTCKGHDVWCPLYRDAGTFQKCRSKFKILRTRRVT